MPESNNENKKTEKIRWHKKAWLLMVPIVSGIGVVVALINGWFTFVKNVKGDKPTKDTVKVITVPVTTIDSIDSKDSCVIARRKLNETGVSWSIQSFVDALVDDDRKNIELFLKGCMPVYAEKEETNIIFYALQPTVKDREWKLRTFINAGFDINRNLSDNKIMRNRSASLPPNYNSPLAPSGYDAYSRHFKGTLGLWLVTWICYSGVKADDEILIRILADNGDRFEVEKDFMKYMESAWGNTDSYKQTLDILNKYSK
jgi:hypothetical protein